MSEIDELKARLAEIEKKLGIASRKPSGRQAEPARSRVNQVAFEQAMEAWRNGNRKPLDRYCRLYRVPT